MADREAFDRIVELQRKKLLSLSLRNPLLSSPLRNDRRTMFRVVDERPDHLFNRLSSQGSGGEMRFAGLPDATDGVPPDEATEAFEIAFRRAQAMDDRYLEQLSVPAPNDDAEAEQARTAIENALRDRLRAELGMAPVDRTREPTLEETAMRLGINPSYELPTGDGEAEARHTDNVIQTLYRKTDLEKREAALWRDVKLKEQDFGYSSLYAVFGCLEWRDAGSPTRPRLAPLILVPLELERRSFRGAKRLYVGPSDREPTSLNICLDEKLRQSGLILPALDEEEDGAGTTDTPESYFAKIERWIERNRPDWRLRRFVQICSIQFSRLAMYRDLDPSFWEVRPGAASLAARLFKAESSEPPLSTGEAIDDREEEERFTAPLVLDADASQLQAIAAALRGESFGLQGPPGAGKSQTIANLIAAAIADGKRVLFLAEKMAALNVVYSRLVEVGLGPFCLQLHSTKARKKDVIEAVRARVDHSSVAAPSDARARKDALKRSRGDLNAYADLMSTSFGAQGQTLHDVLWSAVAARTRFEALTGAAPRLELQVVGAETWSTEHTVEMRSLVTVLAEQYEAVRADRRSDGLHPLRGIDLVRPDSFARDRLKKSLASAAAALADVVARFSPLLEVKTLSVNQLNAVLSDLDALDELIDPLAVAVLATLRSSRGEELRRFIDRVVEFRSTEEVPAFAEREKELLDDPAFALSIASEAHASLGLQATLADLRRRRDLLNDQAERLDLAIEAAKSLLDELDASGNTRVIDVMDALDAIGMLEESPSGPVDWLDAPLDDDQLAHLEQASATVVELDSLRQELSTVFDTAAFDADPRLLRSTADVLKGAGVFAFLSRKVRNARRMATAWLKDPEQRSHQRTWERLQRLADFIRSKSQFRSDTRLFEALGEQPVLDVALFERRIAAEIFRRRAVDRFSGLSRMRKMLSELLLTSSPERRRSLATLLPKQSREEVRKVLQGGQARNLSEMRAEADALTTEAAELRDLHRRVDALGLEASVVLVEIPRMCDQRRSYIARRDDLDAAPSFGATFEPLIRGSRTDPSPLLSLLRRADAIGQFPVATARRAEFETVDGLRSIVRELEAGSPVARRASEALIDLSAASDLDPLEFIDAEQLCAAPINNLASRLDEASSAMTGLNSWLPFQAARRAVSRHAALGPVMSELELLEDRERLTVPLAEALVDVSICQGLARRAYEAYPALTRFTGVDQSEAQSRYRDLDSNVKTIDRELALSALTSRHAPEGVSRGRVGDFTEMGLIKHQLQLQHGHRSIRYILNKAGGALYALMPCVMMSPASVAQHLPRRPDCFDLLIIDEASQMRPEDALGGLLRSRAAVIVGDPKQMPPSDLFTSRPGETADDDNEDPGDVESVLTLAYGNFERPRRLRWHYRSRHESLIAFSNQHFYNGELEVFPSADRDASRLGVSYQLVESGYRKSLNVPEAKAVVDFVARHARQFPNESLGIVALNAPQADMIHELLELLRVEDPEVADFFARFEDGLEPIFVKNLENVQGDERDAIALSTVYGADESGAVHQRFGLLNRSSGDRRLNVLITRAKKRVHVVTSLRPGDVRITDSSRRGVKMLHDYLEFARTGELPTLGVATGRAPDSAFETSVLAALHRHDVEAEPQIGVHGYVIDIGVRDPHNPQRFFLGVECDGARYHQTRSARERDRLRQQVLEGLGWRIHRIWSTDWFERPDWELERLLRSIRDGASNAE